MLGAPFPAITPSGGSGGGAVNVFRNAGAAALSGTFTVPATPAVIAIIYAWQDNGLGAFTSATIGGHAATIIVPEFHGGECVAIAAALVSPGDTNTYGCSGPSVFSSQCATYVYQIDGVTRVFSPSAAGGAGTSNGSCVLSIPANACVIAGSSAHGAVAVTPSWTGISYDTSYLQGRHAISCAFDNYAAAASPTVTANMSGANTTAMAAAVFTV